MSVYRIDPLNDLRWAPFLGAHTQASIFHASEWLEALWRTYAYRPVAFTHSAPGQDLNDAIVFCEIRSWLTGRRMVSLPFSDHSQPLVPDAKSLSSLLCSVKSVFEDERWKYLELRPLSWPDSVAEGEPKFSEGNRFYFHTLDLESGLDSIFKGFHNSCIQRKIRRAEREDLTYERGLSSSLLQRFYSLLMCTRRRHRIPPQPFNWFSNLSDCLGDRLTIRMVSKEGMPVAAILTLSYKGTIVYKYGGSDEQFHNLGGMPFLFWKLIEESKAAGAKLLDLGRTDLGNEGLLQFKERLGAIRKQITYRRYPASEKRDDAAKWHRAAAGNLISVLPGTLSSRLSGLLYRHVG